MSAENLTIISANDIKLDPDEVARVRNISDEDIDFSEIPELSADFWDNAVIVYPDKKERISIRLDSEIIAFFKSQGKGYQSKINAVLKHYVTTKRRSRRKVKKL